MKGMIEVLWLAVLMNIYRDVLVIIDWLWDLGIIDKIRRDHWFLAVSRKGLKAMERSVTLGQRNGADTERMEVNITNVSNELDSFEYWM